jgi:hypothetical protein
LHFCSVLYHFCVFYLSHIYSQHSTSWKKLFQTKNLHSFSIHSFASLLAFIFTELSFQNFIYSSFFFGVINIYIFVVGLSGEKHFSAQLLSRIENFKRWWVERMSFIQKFPSKCLWYKKKECEEKITRTSEYHNRINEKLKGTWEL